jgi:hypothetical protein
MANKAFIIDASPVLNDPTLGNVIRFGFFILDPDGDVVPAYQGASDVSTVDASVGYGDNAQSLHEKGADAIRSQTGDSSLIVVALDSPGRY